MKKGSKAVKIQKIRQHDEDNRIEARRAVEPPPSLVSRSPLLAALARLADELEAEVKRINQA